MKLPALVLVALAVVAVGRAGASSRAGSPFDGHWRVTLSGYGTRSGDITPQSCCNTPVVITITNGVILQGRTAGGTPPFGLIDGKVAVNGIATIAFAPPFTDGSRTCPIELAFKSTGVADSVGQISCDLEGATFTGTLHASKAKTPVGLVALGDSFSSGEGTQANGNPAYTGGSCHRSTLAWPSVFAHSTGRRPFTNLACSGAVIKDVPGQIAQLMHAYPPALITITIGGNNLGFSSLLTTCVNPTSNCASRATALSTQLAGLSAELVATYRTIEAAAPTSTLVVVGYPRLFPAPGQPIHCPWLGEDERTAIDTLQPKLDTAIRNAAATAGAEFVSTLNALNGHELCSGNPYMYSVNGYGGTNQGHPTAEGQALLAQAVGKALHH